MTYVFRPLPKTPVVSRALIPPPPPRKRTRRYNRPEFGKKIAPSLEPILRFMFEEMLRQGMHERVMAERVGCHYDTIGHWRRGCAQPRIGDLVAALNVLGFTLTPTRVEAS